MRRALVAALCVSAISTPALAGEADVVGAEAVREDRKSNV